MGQIDLLVSQIPFVSSETIASSVLTHNCNSQIMKQTMINKITKCFSYPGDCLNSLVKACIHHEFETDKK